MYDEILIPKHYVGSADMIGDMMTDLRPDFRRRDEPNELYLVIGLDSLPKPLKANMSAPFYDGLQFVYKEAASILTQPDRIPTCSILREASKLGAYGYYSRGGEPQYALEAVVEMSSDQSPLGDNTFEEYELDGWSELPVCENDLEFKTVRIKLGLPAYPPRVGFDAMGEFDDEDEDEDEDDEDE